MFGTGPAKALDKWDLPRVCVRHGWHPAALEAIKRAESGGFGWFRNHQIKMLPEPHVFLRQIKGEKRRRAIATGVATTTSFKKTMASGHYRRMKGPKPRYDLFEKWREIDEEAAFRSCSWGTYQIMGFNHEVCGYPTAKAMVLDFLNGEKVQLEALVRFLLSKGLKEPIRKLQFRTVALKYNGSGQVNFYSKEISNWYRKLVNGKWKNWDPSKVPPASPSPPNPVPKPDPKPDPGKPNPKPEETNVMWKTLLSIGGSLVSALFPGGKSKDGPTSLLRTLSSLFGVNTVGESSGILDWTPLFGAGTPMADMGFSGTLISIFLTLIFNMFGEKLIKDHSGKPTDKPVEGNDTSR